MSERERFEAFFAGRNARGVKGREKMFARLPADDTYADDSTQRHWWTWQNALARSGQAASGSGQGARSDVQNGVGQPEAPTAAPLELACSQMDRELQAVLDWARTERKPLREQEIASIVRVLSNYRSTLAHPPARSGAGSEEGPNHFRDATEMVQPAQPDRAEGA